MSVTGYINVSMESFGGLLSLIFILCICITGLYKEKMERRYICLLACNTVLLFCDALAWLFKGRTDTLSYYGVRISNFLVFSLGYVILVLFTYYLAGYLETKGVRIGSTVVRLMTGFMILAVGFVVLSQFNHMYYSIDGDNIYRRQEWFWLSQVFGAFGLVINGGILIRYRKLLNCRELLTFGIYITLPLSALIFQILFYGIAVLYLATTICLLGIYISIQWALSKEMGQKELDLEKSNTALALSQIQPHFLFNSLLGIKELCDKNPEKASEALEHFSYFLRRNLDSISERGLIPFEQELQYVQDYLYLEKMRFEERLIIRWEIDYRHFLIPSLTLQPIVENAVRYGIIRKDGGGTLTIRSVLQADAAVITVLDDGDGFDVNKPTDDGKSHIGIENVRSRLKSQCGGILKIYSVKGFGTQVNLILPQGGVHE